MIFVDSNVPMYIVGDLHPNKERALNLLARLLGNGEQFATDTEVYQEILHRYTAIHRPDAIDAAVESLDAIVDSTLTFGMSEVRAAISLIGAVDGLSARCALHAVVMRNAGISRIISFDSGFDACPGIERLSEPPAYGDKAQ